MKKTIPKHRLAFACIVKGTADEAEAFGRLMANVRPYVDAVYVTFTRRPGESVPGRCRAIAREFSCEVSYFDWINDFSAARNYNFEQVPEEYEYIMWGDADDQFRGLEKLRAAIDEHPQVDAFAMFYLYGFDADRNPIVVHQKTQIIRREAADWIGHLHEDFSPRRKLETYLIKGIERLHMTNEERTEAAKIRNLEVAEQQVADQPEDPRSYWNLGNARHSLHRYPESIEAFSRFLEISQSDDEKYIVRLRRAEAYWSLSQRSMAIEDGRYAIGLKPAYPDAYNLLGSLYLETKQFEQARDMLQMALTRRPPYYRILVFNPRDYDYTPLMNLAKVYFSLSQPELALVCLRSCLKIMPKNKHVASLIKVMEREKREMAAVSKQVEALRKIKSEHKLQAAYDALPQKYRAHPAVLQLRNSRLIKKTSSGRDLVFMCGFTQEEWNPDSVAKKGIGGSEEAILWLSKLLAAQGWNVSVYNNCGAEEMVREGVTFRPYWTWNYRDRQDIVVLWRSPAMARYEINAPRVLCDLHDVIPPDEFTPERLARIDRIMVKSAFHRSLFPDIPDEKFAIIPNGIASDIFKE